MRWLARLDGLRGWRADLVALALGVLSATALPPYFVLPALLVAVPGLLRLIDGARGAAVAFRRGWWFGVGHHLLGLYWITEAILIEAARFWWFIPLAVPALSALLALFIAAPAAVARAAPPGCRRVLAFAGAWTLFDVGRAYLFTGFPWDPWGMVWALPGAAGDVMLQPTAWVGVYGLTLATLLLAAVPTFAAVFGRRAWLCGGAVLALWIVVGLVRLGTAAAAAPQPPVTVALVQGDVPQGDKWDRDRMLEIFRRYLSLTSAAVAAMPPGGRRVVVWPETASPFLLTADPGARRAIVAAAGGAPVLAGTVRFDPDGRPRNSLLAIAPDGGIAGIYDKWHLVPFGEFQPSWFPLPIQVVPGGGFAAGGGPQTLHLPGIPPAGAVICYEVVYSAQIVDGADWPDWLVNVTNDAWFGNSSGPRQHLAAARMRAVENGMPLMRAANTGITAGFDAFGRELGRLPMRERGYLNLALPGRLAKTFYGRIGLLLPCFVSFTLVAVSLAAPLRRRVTQF